MQVEIETKFIDRQQAVIEVLSYAHNQRPGLQLTSLEGEPLAMATVNMPEVRVPHNHVLIKDYSENEGMLATLLAAGVIEDPVDTIPAGFVEVHMCKLCEELQQPEPDLSGFEIPKDFQGLLGCEVEPMDPEAMQMLMACTMMESEQINGVFAEMQKEVAQMKILLSRIPPNVLPKLSRRLLVVVAGLCNSPGACVMWAFTLCKMWQQHKDGLTLEHFSTEFFPMGLPTEADHHARWDQQKVTGARSMMRGDNFLDWPEMWSQFDE